MKIYFIRSYRWKFWNHKWWTWSTALARNFTCLPRVTWNHVTVKRIPKGASIIFGHW
jgi:hypothetical protein